jgi:predicted enzyme related to lactoylglutathione lyase
MAADIELVLDVNDLDRMADFYCAVLGYEPRGAVAQYRSVAPPSGETGPKLILQRVDEPKTAKNRLHIDVKSDDIEREADRLESLGASRVRRYEEVDTAWILMADPEGNELCVCQE